MLFDTIEKQARSTSELLESVAHVCNAINETPNKHVRVVIVESVKELKGTIGNIIRTRTVDQHLAHLLAKTIVLAGQMQQEVAWRRDIKLKPYADQLIQMAAKQVSDKFADPKHNHTEDPISIVDELRVFKDQLKITPWSNRDSESRDKAMSLKRRVVELLDRIAVKAEQKIERSEPQLTVMSLTSQILSAKSHEQKKDVLDRIEDLLKTDFEKGEEGTKQ